MQQLVKLIEALLLAAGRPLTTAELTKASGQPSEDVLAALDVLNEEMADRGIRVVRSHGAVELASAPEHAEAVERFLQAEQASPLSKPALETLAVILHKQPATKYEVEEVRGVASEQSIRNLLGRGLIEEAGRRAEAGRPMQYAATTTLLRQLGITDAAELSDLGEASDAH